MLEDKLKDIKETKQISECTRETIYICNSTRDCPYNMSFSSICNACPEAGIYQRYKK